MYKLICEPQSIHIDYPMLYVRRNFMTPLPVATSFDALNAKFRDACAKRGKAILRGHTKTIAERMQAGPRHIHGLASGTL